MRDLGTWVALAAVACFGPLASGTQEAAPLTEGEFVALRPPVLGHVVEWRAADDAYRLLDGTIEVFRGTLEQCEEALLARLVARWGTGLPNVPLATMGAKQLWADVFWCAGWRIQESVLTGHCRLLDRDDARVAWGSFEACRTVFEKRRNELGLRPGSERLVVLLHGLGRSRASLRRLADALRAAGWEVADLAYPSTRRSLEEHAAQLTRVLDGLEGIETVSFVTHSLGGLVVRAALARSGEWRQRLSVARLAMLAPPSRGSELARRLSEWLPLQWVLGPALQELALQEALAVPVPSCPFGIVAGSQRDGAGLNPLLTGDDDGIVTLDEALLPGAEDTLVVPALHTFLMDDPLVIASVVRYLATGHFADAESGS